MSKFKDCYPRTEGLVELAVKGIAGVGWYDTAADEIETVCDSEDWVVEKFVGILSVTSPRVAVRRNIRNTLQYFGTGKFLEGTMKGVLAAVKHLGVTGKIRGPKTRAFNDALLGVSNAIVLDVHMARVLNVPQAAFDSKVVRGRCEQAVVEVSKAMGIKPADAQACLWYGQKMSVGERPEPFPIVEEWKNFIEHGRKFPTSGEIELKVKA